MTYEEASKLPRSEKITLITCDSVAKVKLFEVHSGTIYKRKTEYFVTDVKLDGVSLEQANDLSELNTTDNWFYEIETKILYVNVGQDPRLINLSVIYRHFFSTAPVILPYDLSSSEPVEWSPIVRNIGQLGQQLDDENTGIVLESQSQIEFINDGFWDDKFDALIWENQKTQFYSWFANIPVTEARKIFDGVIESKEFDSSKVVFRVKDFVFKLRNKLNLELFSELDGNLPESFIGKPKRRIYGQVRQAKAIPLDCILDGYEITGTVSITQDYDIMTGVGTLFLDELNQDDEIIFIYNNEEVIYSVDLISSNTSLKMSKKAEQSLSNQTVKIDPARPWRKKNRRWHIAGHKIRQTEAIITDIINARTFVVDDVSEFVAGDVVRVLGQTTQITRVSGNQLVLEQNIFPVPIVGNIIFRYPINAVHFGERELIPLRDFTIENVGEAILVLDQLAEFNIAREIVTDHNLQFNNNSTMVSSNASADLRTIISPGDFIRAVVQNNTAWYEVHHVGPQVIYLKTPFNQGGGNTNSQARIKKMEVVSDDSLITVSCYGKELDSKLVRTASDAVLDLISNDAGFENIDLDSFEQAKSDCSYTLSMLIPEEPGGDVPLIRDIISKINDSVLGSLYGNSTQNLAYSIVNTRRPADILPIKDDDIISWSVQTNQQIVNSVKINYAPFTDLVLGSSGFKSIVYNNDFVTQEIGIENQKEKTCYLFNDSEALVIAQRTAFYNSLSQSILTIKGKANFFTSAVNDRLYIELDRLYKRFGGSYNRKIGVVSGVKLSQYNSEIVMNDLGNIFNRCPVIAPNGIDNFTDATPDEKIKFGYILDNDTLTPDATSEEALGSHLIG